MTEPKPELEWCLEHERHEPIPACEPDYENYEYPEEEKSSNA